MGSFQINRHHSETCGADGKDCCDPEEEKLGEACKNSDCNKIKLFS